MNIRKAHSEDVQAVVAIYDEIHTEEEAGHMTTCWIRNVYPTMCTAGDALDRGDLFVMENDGGEIVGAAIINQTQVDVYADGCWQQDAPAEEVMVLHTLVISPKQAGKGFGKTFVHFYEQYALENGCRFLRMDTNVKNVHARKIYAKLGYREAGVVPCIFNGIEGVQLVLLEKTLSDRS